MSKEAMKLALEALRTLHDENMDYLTRNNLGGENNQCMVFARETITALRQALETEREWVGLTADEIWKCNKAKSGSAVEFHICYEHQNVLDFAESIEAKLKEKNHG